MSAKAANRARGARAAHSQQPASSVTPARDVAIIVYDGLAMFEFGVACEIFAIDRSDELATPWYKLKVCAARVTITTDGAFRMQIPHRLSALDSAGTILVPPCEMLETLPGTVLSALRRAHQRGARIVSLCTGAFVLAAAGLLDGRRATTHWSECERLHSLHPTIDVDPSVLYVDDGDILTSAGSAASIDLCLHIVAGDHGAQTANQLARRLVVAPHRQGGQAQYIDTPVPERPEHDLFTETIAWAQSNLHNPIAVGQLASRSAMSQRTFARRFAATTGTTPYQWLLTQRLRRAQQLLEATDLPVELIARQSGFADATVLRKHFARNFHTSPTAYRRSFSSRAHPPTTNGVSRDGHHGDLAPTRRRSTNTPGGADWCFHEPAATSSAQTSGSVAAVAAGQLKQQSRSPGVAAGAATESRPERHRRVTPSVRGCRAKV